MTFSELCTTTQGCIGLNEGFLKGLRCSSPRSQQHPRVCGTSATLRWHGTIHRDHVHPYPCKGLKHTRVLQPTCGTMACCEHGPGHASPLAAFRSGEQEELVYVPAIVPDHSRPDYLAVVDVKPGSDTYSQVIYRLPMPHLGDELHHSGWNACSSCYTDNSKQRKYLILPGVASGRIYAVDVSEPRKPKLHHTVEAADIAAATGLAYPHTSHCLGNGDIMVSMMGQPDGKAIGNFLLLTSDLKVKGKWAAEDTSFGYDFWYQPGHNVMVSTEFGAPSAFMKGFDPAVATKDYGSKLYVWDWRGRTIRQTLDLGAEGLIPLEVRFAHEPTATWGMVGAALSSNVLLFQLDPSAPSTGPVTTSVVIKQPWLDVTGWALPQLPPLITDILLSLDDKYLFFSNWLRGDVCMYDVSDPTAPVLVDRVWLGGSITRGSGVTVSPESLAALGLTEQPEPAVVKGVKLQGGPQMLQLSLDGTRLYVTNSLISPWDSQFYPDMATKGSQLVQVEVDANNGRLALKQDFLVDFGAEPEGPVLAHECRYPGGDCSSDIWLAPGTSWPADP